METTNKQKVAVIMIALGVDYTAKIYKHLNDNEIEAITLEVVKMKKLETNETNDILVDFIKILVDKNSEVAAQIVKTLL